MSLNPKPSEEDYRAAVEQGKREILEDMCTAVSSRKTVMPLNVSSFSELHDYVDANEYAGLCAERHWWANPDPNPDAWLADINRLQNELHDWLEQGHARTEKVAMVLFAQFGLFGQAPTVSWWEQSDETRTWWREQAGAHLTALALND